LSRKRPSPSALATSASRASGVSAVEQHAQRPCVEPVQDQHLRAGEECRVQLEARVLGRRADQSDGAVLDIGQEAVLLGAIEAVDLVHEQQGALADRGMVARGGEHLAQIGDAREHGRDRLEPQANRFGEQPCDRGLAGTRRTPEHHGRKPAGGDHSPDRAFGSGQMLLPDHVVEPLRPQPVGERRRLRWVRGEQVSQARPPPA
jgi:hypothetical protein